MQKGQKPSGRQPREIPGERGGGQGSDPEGPGHRARLTGRQQIQWHLHPLAAEAPLRRGQAPLLLHRPHHHGHRALATRHDDPQRDLQLHRAPLPLLQGQHTPLAELHPPQPLAQRLLRQGVAERGEAGQGQLLGAASEGGRHVRQRQLPQKVQALQDCGQRRQLQAKS